MWQKMLQVGSGGSSAFDGTLYSGTQATADLWENFNGKYSTTATSIPVIAVTTWTPYMYLDNPNSDGQSRIIITKKNVSFNGFTKLRVEFEQTITSDSGVTPVVSLKNTNTGYIFDSSDVVRKVTANTGTREIEIDVSDLQSNKYYIAIGVLNRRACKITKVILY